MPAVHATSKVVESASTVIRRSPETVFRFVGEQFFTNYPRWSPGVQELSQIGSGPVQVGTRARQVRVEVGHRSESTFELTRFETGQRVCFEGISCPYRCDYEIQTISSQFSTLVCFTFQLFELEIRLRPFESQIREVIRNRVELTVRNLKCLLEARTTECVTAPGVSTYR